MTRRSPVQGLLGRGKGAPAVSTLSDRLLAEVVARHLNVEAGSLRVNHCPTGKFNMTYFVEGAGRPMVLRIAPADDPEPLLFYEYRMMRQEPALHALIRARTTLPVPAIIAHDDTGRYLDREFLVMERLAGKPLCQHRDLTPDACEDLLRRVGAGLRDVHAITGSCYGYVGEHHPMTPEKDWASAFRVMWHKLVEDIHRCGGYTAAETTMLLKLLDRHAGAFERRVRPSLLHMDVWAQNILTDESGTLTGLIDWDRALWGDPEIEFAVLDYCGISTPAFWEGYGRARDRSHEAEVRRGFYLLYELQKHIFIERARRKNPARAEAYRERCFHVVRQLMHAR